MTTNVLNTLYVTTDDARVHLEGETLRVVIDNEKKAQVPMHHLASLVVMARVFVTPEAMAACADAGISVVFLTGTGRFQARVEGNLSRASMLRREQYRAADDPTRTLSLARACVAGKIANTRTFLLKARRTRAEEAGSRRFDDACARLLELGRHVLQAEQMDQLRGMEGEAASHYFDLFDAIIDREEMRFEKRTRRPPLNPVNALLSFGYSLLAADCQSALQSANLDPSVGYLHVERPGRPALALDLMEELRTPIVDRMVVSILRLGQFKPDDFESLPTGEWRMKDAARKKFLIEYQQRKRDEVTHPLAANPIPWGMVPLLQARLMARAIREETEYIPFLLK
ncbi:MAG: type I-C CRISPR-associated endonuclease Cas1c [Myxococcales bacterium]|jgi:CRISPR-associated protein Cas1|nr:type I-C CRISPR-associated endonuclease Cas1c [Myxococcales bacterium]